MQRLLLLGLLLELELDLIELLFEFFKFLPEVLLSDVVPIHSSDLLFEV